MTTRKVTPFDLHIGQRIKVLRNTAGLNQNDFAAKLGVSQQQVQKIENGLNRISAGRLWEVSIVLGVPVSAFFEGLANG